MSSDVLLQLKVDGELLRIGQVCDKVLYLREPVDLPPTDAELLITVNGDTTSHGVFLHNGSSKDSDAVEFF